MHHHVIISKPYNLDIPLTKQLFPSNNSANGSPVHYLANHLLLVMYVDLRYEIFIEIEG
jgi:hypothetical protein